MYENSNQDVLRELTKDNYRSHKTRNRLAILAIALTTILITAVLTVGISVTSTVLNYGEAAPGPGSIGSITGTKETCQKIRKLSNVTHADYIAKCSNSPLRNDEFAGMTVYLMAGEEGYYKNNYVTLEEGHFPKNAQEIILSDNMVKKLSLKNPVVGQKVTLRMMIQENGEPVEKSHTFTVCGYFKNPLITLEDTYDEIYTGEDFVSQYNPQLEGVSQSIYVAVNDLNPLLMKTDVIEKLTQITDAVDAEGYATKYTSNPMDLLAGILPAGVFVLFIILSGYFLIYNVFYLSISSDIRWFGMLKTLGCTGRQLKKILMAQIRRLACWGIGIGIVIGYVVGNYLAPGLMSQTIYESFYKAPNRFLIFCLGALFAWVTIYISAHRSLHLASKISPVEAAKYVPRKRKNTFTVLSFALSGIMFMVAANLTLGYSVDKMVDRYHMDDMTLLQKNSIWTQEDPYQPIQEETVEEIRRLPFVSKAEPVYTGRSMEYLLYGSNGQQVYQESQAEVKLQGKISKLGEVVVNSLGGANDYLVHEDRNSVQIHITGLPSQRLERQKPYIKILEGDLDREKFAQGDYILWNVGTLIPEAENFVHVGDTFDLSVYDGARDTWHTKKVRVLAVVQSEDMYGTGDLGFSEIVMSEKGFQEVFPDYQTMIGRLNIQTKGEITQEEQQQIKAIYEKEHSTQIQAQDRATDRVSFQSQKRTMSLIGLFLASLLAIIGLSNMVNTITSDVFSRKIELATLQSIGMTKSQLWKMLFGNVFRLSMISMAIIFPVGSALAYFLASHPIFTGFRPSVYLVSTGALLVVILGLCVALTSILVRVLNQKSIVERLREIE